MKVLVATASEHGSTAEIGGWIAEVLRGEGHEVEVAEVDEAPNPRWFDAVVLGSAVYAGRWMKEAREYVREMSEAFADTKVWIFSSGPLGDPPKPTEDPMDVKQISASVGAREHRVFSGRLIRANLGFAHRAIVSALHAPDGDFRDRGQIEAWAKEISAALE